MARKDVYILLTVRLAKDDDHWEAECIELGTATFADTLDAALEEVVALIELKMNTLEDLGAARAFLHKHGITLHRTAPKDTARQVGVRPGEVVARVPQHLELAGAGT